MSSQPTTYNKWLRAALTLLALVSVELNVLCNPFAVTHFFRFIQPAMDGASKSPGIGRLCDAEAKSADEPAEESREGRATLEAPPEIDDVIALRPRPTLWAIAPDDAGSRLFALLDRTCVDFECKVDECDRLSVLRRLCRMRC